MRSPCSGRLPRPTNPKRLWTLQIRIGLHAGEAILDDGDYHGTAVVVAKRLCDRADGGQILAGDLLRVLVGSRGGFRFRPAGPPVAQRAGRAAGGRRRGLGERQRLRPLRRLPLPLRPYRPSPLGGDRTGGLPSSSAGSRNWPGSTRELDRARAGELRCVVITGEAGDGQVAPGRGVRRASQPRQPTWWRPGPTRSAARGLQPLGRGLGAGLGGDVADDVVRLCGGFVDDLAGLLHGVAASGFRARRCGRAAPAAPDRRPDPPPRRALPATGRSSLCSTTCISPTRRHGTCCGTWPAASPTLPVARRRHCPARRVGGQRRGEPRSSSNSSRTARSPRFELGPLPRAGLAGLAEVLIGRRPPPALVDWLADRTQGECSLRRGPLAGRCSRKAPTCGAAPRSVCRRVSPNGSSAGSAHSRRGSRHAGVARRARPPGGARRARSGHRASAGGPGRNLETLLAGRAVTETERGRRVDYEIHHPLVRDVIYQAVGGAARRRVLHRRWLRP